MVLISLFNIHYWYNNIYKMQQQLLNAVKQQQHFKQISGNLDR